MRVHASDVLGDADNAIPPFPFSCKVVSSSELQVTGPLLDHSDAGHEDELIRAILTKKRDAGKDVECIARAMDNARKETEEKMDLTNPTVNTKNYVLRFPPDVKLDAEILDMHKGKKNGLLQIEALPVMSEVAVQVKKRPLQKRTIDGVEVDVYPVNNSFRLLWRIADMSKRGITTGRSKKATAATDAATQMMEDMGL